MRIFLTGATGYIGSAVLDALVRHGHVVTALVRDPGRLRASDSGAVHPVVADLGDAGAWSAGLADHDAFIHAGFDGSARGIEADRAATVALLDGAKKASAAGRQPVVIYTSSVWILGNTPKPADEEAPVQPAATAGFRPGHEALVLAVNGPAVRTAVVRPGIVVGGGRGIVGDFFRDAANGLIRVIGPGQNHWPFVYDRDIADLYVRILAQPQASGVFHAVDEGDERVNDAVEAIASHMNNRPDIRHVPINEARAKWGAYADGLALDQIVRSHRSRALGWAPSLKTVAENVPRLYEEWRNGQRRGSDQ